MFSWEEKSRFYNIVGVFVGYFKSCQVWVNYSLLMIVLENWQPKNISLVPFPDWFNVLKSNTEKTYSLPVPLVWIGHRSQFASGFSRASPWRSYPKVNYPLLQAWRERKKITKNYRNLGKITWEIHLYHSQITAFLYNLALPPHVLWLLLHSSEKENETFGWNDPSCF